MATAATHSRGEQKFTYRRLLHSRRSNPLRRQMTGTSTSKNYNISNNNNNNKQLQLSNSEFSRSLLMTSERSSTMTCRCSPAMVGRQQRAIRHQEQTLNDIPACSGVDAIHAAGAHTATRAIAAATRQARRKRHQQVRAPPHRLLATLASVRPSASASPSSSLFAILVLGLSLICTIASLAPQGAVSMLLVPDTQASTCPLSECMCYWSSGKKIANCGDKALRGLPTQLQSDTQVLNMTGNHLAQLPPRIFQERRLTNLQRLYLAKCKLAYIADEAFAQLTNLVELDLSHNNLQQVPTKPFELLKYSLRKLSLAFNQIHVIDSAAFSPLGHLENLDLAHSMVGSLRANAFAGLHELRALRLNENRLSQLPLNALSGLPENLEIHLYGNPWHCDCELRQSIEWMQRNRVQPPLNPTCATPARHKDIRWQNVKPDDFMCPPVILNKQEEIVVGAGSNVTLACSARGSPPLTFVWFQDEKNLTVQGSQASGGAGASTSSAGQPAASATSEPPPSTKLLEEHRYEIQEELSPPNITTSILYLMNLKLTDTSVFLCWVQNDAGYSLGNFSLIVDESAPVTGYGTSAGAAGGLVGGLGGSLGRLIGIEPGQTTNGTQLLIVLLAFLLLLAATIVCLFVLKQVAGGRSSKSSSNSDIKSQQQKPQKQNKTMLAGKLESSSKFAPMNGASAGRMFAPSDDDCASDDEDQRSSLGGGVAGGGSHSSGSQSSCNKSGSTTRVLAVEELDGFIDHLRSGIINMDYHSMSPVIQFNTQKKPLAQQLLERAKRDGSQSHLQDQHPLTHLSHFPSASNASSQALYSSSSGGGGGGSSGNGCAPGGGVHASNGSNSMATTLSDLSPSSGSASTSFANPMGVGNPLMAAAGAASQQRNQYVPNMEAMLRQQPMSYCDYRGQPQQQQRHLSTDLMAATTSYTSDYQSGYGEDPIGAPSQQQQQHHLRHQHQQMMMMMPPMYTDLAGDGQLAGYHPHQQHNYAAGGMLGSSPSRPSPSGVGHNVAYHGPDGDGHPLAPMGAHLVQHGQQPQYRMQESPSGASAHIL